jgi:ADP-heptose:LPS heptosyltransferase
MFWLGVPLSEIPRAKLGAGMRPSYPPYVVMHPFAATAEKSWPRERFHAVADQMQSAGLLSVIVAGPADDTAAFSNYQVLRNSPLSALKSLMSGADLFIGNDSGPAHVAAAFGIPVIVLFGPSDPVTWAPWRTEARVLTSPGSIDQIAVDEVITAAEALRNRNVKAEA